MVRLHVASEPPPPATRSERRGRLQSRRRGCARRSRAPRPGARASEAMRGGSHDGRRGRVWREGPRSAGRVANGSVYLTCSGAAEKSPTRAVRADDEDDHRFLLRPCGHDDEAEGCPRGDRTSTRTAGFKPRVGRHAGPRRPHRHRGHAAKFTARPARKVRLSARAVPVLVKPRVRQPRPASADRPSSGEMTPYPAPPHPARREGRRPRRRRAHRGRNPDSHRVLRGSETTSPRQDVHHEG